MLYGDRHCRPLFGRGHGQHAASANFLGELIAAHPRIAIEAGHLAGRRIGDANSKVSVPSNLVLVGIFEQEARRTGRFGKGNLSIGDWSYSRSVLGDVAL